MALVDFSRLTATVETDVELAPLTTYKLGGAARWFAEPDSEAALIELVRRAVSLDVPIVVIGRGSNMVVSDSGFDGLVLHLGRGFTEITLDDTGIVTAGAGTPLPRLARFSVDEGRGGLEFLIGVPGSVGGAVRMNAGCLGSETSDWMIDTRILDTRSGVIRTATPAELEMGYRTTTVGDTDIVFSARFTTVDRESAVGRETLREVTRWRRLNQPGGTLNAGSVFKNPAGDTAGRIIDAAGLKGFAVGGAAVSVRHANFFEAGPDATATDVFRLVREVRGRVAAATGVQLEPELRFVGRFDGGSL